MSRSGRPGGRRRVHGRRAVPWADGFTGQRVTEEAGCAAVVCKLGSVARPKGRAAPKQLPHSKTHNWGGDNELPGEVGRGVGCKRRKGAGSCGSVCFTAGAAATVDSSALPRPTCAPPVQRVPCCTRTAPPHCTPHGTPWADGFTGQMGWHAVLYAAAIVCSHCGCPQFLAALQIRFSQHCGCHQVLAARQIRSRPYGVIQHEKNVSAGAESQRYYRNSPPRLAPLFGATTQEPDWG
eukprot:scaffold75857_cov64-Phaeocystis_antarctica.AAC.3